MGLYAELQNILEVAFFYPFLIPCLSFYYMPICKGVERSRRLEVHLVKSRKLWWSNNGIP
jgi:hypothetical protein